MKLRLLHYLQAAVAVGTAVVGISSSAQSSTYPDRPVKIVVPYAPGGPVDLLARSVAEKLTAGLQKPFVVENKPGGNTIVAASYVAKSPADGYTLYVASSASLAVNPVVYKKLSYDPDKDFAPVSMLARAPLVLVVSQSNPAHNLKDLVGFIRSKDGNFAYASNGNGNPLHLACALFGNTANLKMLHVPYNGTAPALTSVLSGDTQMACDIVLNSLPQIKAGKLRPIGILGPRRSEVIPEVPTLAEQGMPGVDATVWFALVAPKGTPKAVVDKLNKTIVSSLQAQDIKSRFSAMGMELASSTPEEVARTTATERQKWAAVVKQNSISID